jgi:hypothetical protein
VELLVGHEGLVSQRRVPELAVIAQVGDVAEHRYIAVGEAAGYAHVLFLGALANLGEDVIVVAARIESIEGA